MQNMASEDANGPDGRKFYGSVTVGERGQIAIPAQARRDHGIEAGDKLIVLGNAEGIALMGVEKLMETLSASSSLLNMLRGQAGAEGS
jgi:AbrB family looped-hinge helix DNA binding protein